MGRAAPAPDLLVTGDGPISRIVRRRTPLILRERTGDYVREPRRGSSGFDGDPEDLGLSPVQRLLEGCLRGAAFDKAPAEWRAPGDALADEHRLGDDHERLRRGRHRRLGPQAAAGCEPRWLKLDAPALRRTGGVAIYLWRTPRVDTVADASARTPGRAVDGQ